MSAVVRPGPAVTSCGATEFQANATEMIGLGTFAALMASPTVGIYGTWRPIVGITGTPVPLTLLSALVIAIPAAINYAIVNRECPSNELASL